MTLVVTAVLWVVQVFEELLVVVRARLLRTFDLLLISVLAVHLGLFRWKASEMLVSASSALSSPSSSLAGSDESCNRYCRKAASGVP